MNGDGGSTQNDGVDGQNITPNSVITNEIKSTDILFTTARQADSLVSPINYVLPITKPPEDGSTYAITNAVDAGGLFTTPSTNSTLQIGLTSGGPNATTLNFTFQANTTFPIDLILTVINERIASWYESIFSNIQVVVSLNVTSFPYSTNIFISSPAATATVLNPAGVNQVATFLGWPATSPSYAGNNTFTSPITNTVTQIIELDNQLIWKKIPTAFNDPTNKIESYDGSTSIVCEDVGSIQSFGNVNYNEGNLSKVGSIAGTATCNITTDTTQIVNGLSEVKINVDTVDRLILNNVKSKMICGVSALQLAAVSDGLSEDTTTFMGASTGPSQNTISIYTPDQYQVIQNNGSIQRLVIDNDSTKLYTKSVSVGGPQASYLNLNDDGTFQLGSFGANRGAIEASVSNFAVVGGGAATSIELSLPPQITTSVFNGSYRSTRQTIDQTKQTFYDDSTVERMRIDNTGVIINNAYSMPLNVGTLAQVLTSNGGSSALWATPQIYGLFSQTSIKTVANTNVETSLIGTGVGSLSVPANYFQNGYSFLYKTGGIFRDSANGQLIRFRLRNSGVLFDSGILVLSNVNTLRGWNIECQFTYYGGNIISNFSFSYTNGNNDSFGFTNQGTNAINNAVPNTLDFTVQWTTASANNTITSNYGTLTKIF